MLTKRPFLSTATRNRERARIRRSRPAGKLKSGHRAFSGPHPAGEPKPRKSVTSFESLYLGEVFTPGLPQEPREANLATRRGVCRRSHKKQSRISTKASAAGAMGREALSSGGPATRESPQPGSPQLGETRSPEALFPQDSRIPKATLRASATPRSSGRTPARR